ncbi:hypothetical protein BC936DRAFT_142788 [Jimgerdemannia flammicorona]|uniref:Uncharacterized protein n=1 Tax=Jimgerdemannia flammicorona TaxID=994334 RepID=A0A433DET8_9FUNG|nr:hypothetical protein BC936DRAFT_142788 [Jimgerdemannia flammicorona]
MTDTQKARPSQYLVLPEFYEKPVSKQDIITRSVLYYEVIIWSIVTAWEQGGCLQAEVSMTMEVGLVLGAFFAMIVHTIFATVIFVVVKRQKSGYMGMSITY